jgi:hypothetical protein
MKTCNRCFEEKPYSEFYEKTNMKDGYRNQCKVCVRSGRVAKRFDLTLDHLNRMKAEHSGECDICGSEETAIVYGTTKTLAVDHCHKTGRIRGFLCQNCNTALGKFNDDIELLKSAIEYLKEKI